MYSLSLNLIKILVFLQYFLYNIHHKQYLLFSKTIKKEFVLTNFRNVVELYPHNLKYHILMITKYCIWVSHIITDNVTVTLRNWHIRTSHSSCRDKITL